MHPRWCRISFINSIIVISLLGSEINPHDKFVWIRVGLFCYGHALVRSATNGRKSVLVCALHLAASTGHCSCDAGCWPNKFRKKYALLNLDFTKDRWIKSFQGYTRTPLVPSGDEIEELRSRLSKGEETKDEQMWGGLGVFRTMANGEDFTNSYLIFRSHRNILDIRTLVLYLVYY